MRCFQYEISAEDEGRKLGKVIMQRMQIAQSRLRSLKAKNAILLDNCPAHTDVRVLKGQMITVVFDDMIARHINPYPIELEIPYRDDDLMVINKPFGIASIASNNKEEMTLENALYAYPDLPERFVYRPVNRLDKGTGGLMIIAMNANVQHQLQKQLHTDHFIREYYAVTDGIPVQAEGRIDLPILEPENGIKRNVGEGGRESHTLYKTVAVSQEKQRALLELRLLTGRTHQIRVHLSALGTPIHGDYIYGQPDENARGYFALFSHRIRLQHPFTGELIDINADAPDWFCDLLR